MKKNISVVIGLNYGDEGKGLITDFLAHRYMTSTAVVRFNGGAQAGHTVQLIDGRRHVFQHIGAGTYAGASTILSKFFVVNPTLFFKEVRNLYSTDFQKKIPNLNMYVDWECLVTTPYDIYVNQAVENARGDLRHGSCGVGFGETIEREERGFSLKVSDIHSIDFIEKLQRLRDIWFPNRLLELGLSDQHSLNQEVFDTFVHNSRHFLKVTTQCTTTDAIAEFDNIIFEGAQGLRLDQNSEDFPNVTRSNTGLQNVSEIINDIDADITVYYITRAYMTRHGAGPLLNEIPKPAKVVDNTNVLNQYQGAIRYALLDTHTMAKSVLKDKNFLSNKTFLTVGVVTCCDQVNADILPGTINRVLCALDTKRLITSYGPTREDVKLSLWADENALLC